MAPQGDQRNATFGSPRHSLARGPPVAAPDTPSPLRPTARPDTRLGNGRPLPEAQRRGFEAALGHDLSAVRLHKGGAADASAMGRGAYAYAYGSHIVLSDHAARAGPAGLKPVLAHELVHVVQQTGGMAGHAQVRPQQRTNLSPRHIDFPFTLDDAESAARNLGSAAVDGLTSAGETIADTAGEVGDFVAAEAEEMLEAHAPGLLAFLRGGVLTSLAELFCGGLNSIVGKVLDPLAEVDLVSGIETTFSDLAASVNRAMSGLGTQASESLGALLEPVIGVITSFGPDIIAFVQTMSNTVNGGLNSLWANVGAPVLQFLEAAGGKAWDAFNGMVTSVWDLIEPLRRTAGRLWDWVSKEFGLAWDSTSSVRLWLEKQAKGAWDAAQALIAPIKRPLMVVGAILLLLSPAGPVLVMTQVLPPIWAKLQWLYANWRDLDVVVRAREFLATDILPFLIGAAQQIRAVVTMAAGWIAGLVGQLVAGVQAVLGAIGPSDCVAALNRVIAHLSDQFTRLQAWADSGFAGLQPALEGLFTALGNLLRPILDFLVRLILVAANPGMLPIAIGAAIWLLLPERFKPTVINFVLDLMIAFISGLPGLFLVLGPMGPLVVAGVLGFLRHLRGGEGVSDQTRIDAANKCAGIAAGGGLMFVSGFAVGLLEGLIDGILDPIKLLIMLVQLVIAGLRVAWRALGQLAPHVLPSAMLMPQHPLEPPSPQASAATAGPTVASISAPRAQGPPLAGITSGAQPAAAMASDADILAALSPDTISAVQGAELPESTDAMEAEATQQVQAEGASVSGLAAMLGGAWDWMIAGAANLGGMLAGALLGLLALPDYDIGNKLGYVAGMILLELLIAYFTAGGYTVVKQGASLGRQALAMFLRFLDFGGEILGLLGRVLAPLKAPIRAAISSAKGALSHFGFLRSIMSKLDDLATRLFRLGDDAASAASHGPRGPHLPDAPRPHAPAASPPHGPAPDGLPGGRAAGESTDAAADRAAREAANAPPARNLDEATEELADGTRRAVDEPGVPQIRDDVAKAAQFAEARLAASQIAAANDAVNTPIPLLLAQLMALKRRYRWIDTFEAAPLGPGRFRIDMIASVTTVDPTYDINASTTPDPDPVPEPTSIPKGTTPNPLARGKNTARWEVADNVRPTSVEATLKEDFGGGTRGDAATEVGHHGDPNDHGGHLIGHRFMGDTPNVGIVPQAGNLNTGAWKRMENEWADWIGSGREVHVKISIRPPGSNRPSSFRVRYQVKDPVTGKVLHGRTATFDNTTGQSFDRIYRDQM